MKKCVFLKKLCYKGCAPSKFKGTFSRENSVIMDSVIMESDCICELNRKPYAMFGFAPYDVAKTVKTKVLFLIIKMQMTRVAQKRGVRFGKPVEKANLRSNLRIFCN